MRRLIVFVAVALLLVCSHGYAQTRNRLLHGLSEVNLVVEDLSPGAKPCGVTEEAIRAAVMYPLSSTKITVDSLADVTLYINVGTLHQDVGCISTVRVQVYDFQKVTLEFSGVDKFATVNLWQSDDILTSNRNRHARQFRFGHHLWRSEDTRRFPIDGPLCGNEFTLGRGMD